MKANEFRIGNVTDKGIIKSFYESGIHIGFGKTFTFSEIKPNILTEDILIKYGFKRQSDGIGWDTFSDGKLQLVEVPTNKGKLIAYDLGSGKYAYIRFEHKLQNLYFELIQTELLAN